VKFRFSKEGAFFSLRFFQGVRYIGSNEISMR